jgi:hypothetical protein
MNEIMKRKFGIYIFTGLIIGAIFGIFLAPRSGNPVLAIGGALVECSISNST